MSEVKVRISFASIMQLRYLMSIFQPQLIFFFTYLIVPLYKNRMYIFRIEKIGMLVNIKSIFMEG